jgi:Fe2+ or Zn2+ uptake regulation protein
MEVEVSEAVRIPAPSGAVERSAGSGRLVCNECGRIEPLRDARIDRALRRLVRRVPLSRADYDLTIYGLCDRCSD